MDSEFLIFMICFVVLGTVSAFKSKDRYPGLFTAARAGVKTFSPVSFISQVGVGASDLAHSVFTKFCLCGVPCERFEVWEPETTEAGREHFNLAPGEERYGIHAIVDGEGHCSAFEGRKYHLTKEQAQAMCDDFNSRDYCDLGVEAGVL